MTDSIPLADDSVCAACGARFHCGMTAGDATCWCFALDHALPVPSVKDTQAESLPTDACLCPACLRQRLAQIQPNS